MNANQPACASSDLAKHWDGIDWSRCGREVRRLQARIVKAVQAGRWGRVKALPRLLTGSFHGKALAVKRVTENRGKRTAGWMESCAAFRLPSIKPSPGCGGAATSRSRCDECLSRRPMENYVRWESRRYMTARCRLPTCSPSVPSRRPRRRETPAAFSAWPKQGRRHCAALHLAESKGSALWVLEGDIRGCFDHISHAWMLRHIAMDKAVLRKWLKAGYVEKGCLFDTKAGTPQGGIICQRLAHPPTDLPIPCLLLGPPARPFGQRLRPLAISLRSVLRRWRTSHGTAWKGCSRTPSNEGTVAESHTILPRQPW